MTRCNLLAKLGIYPTTTSANFRLHCSKLVLYE